MSGPIEWDGGLTAAMSVKDMGAAVAWYQDVLGFQLLYKLDEMGWCELQSPVARVNVGLSQVEEPKVEGGTTLTFGVKDIEATRTYLEGRDVRFDGPTQEIPGMVKLATFFDPDGNHLMLFQSLAEGPEGG